MKIEALIFGGLCILSPLYGVYASAISEQAAMQYAETLDSGEDLFVDSDIALMRARFCQIPVDVNSGESVPTLFGLDGMTLEEGRSGPQFVCGLDGTTAKHRWGDFGDRAAVEEKDLERYHKILMTRGLIEDHHIQGFQDDDPK